MKPTKWMNDYVEAKKGYWKLRLQTHALSLHWYENIFYTCIPTCGRVFLRLHIFIIIFLDKREWPFVKRHFLSKKQNKFWAQKPCAKISKINSFCSRMLHTMLLLLNVWTRIVNVFFFKHVLHKKLMHILQEIPK